MTAFFLCEPLLTALQFLIGWVKTRRYSHWQIVVICHAPRTLKHRVSGHGMTCHIRLSWRTRMNTPSNITSASATEAKHARPHLETHTRGQNHSAVAGAAYRLGIKLYDERAGVWHDFRKRALGEEIVLALTVAPQGAPSWATDPAQLWNRVELAEKRKDAQLARDYRIPIPFGLSDQHASAMAEEMARYISRELHTPVSIGLHRDADRDALGVVKLNEKQGFHAHLYFPTRRLFDLKGGDGKEEGGEGGSGFGAKLSMLSNKRTSIIFVEALNAKWAALANQYTRDEGLPADYDHRSYKRLGLDIQPQPTVGRHVSAMERKGIVTRKGDRLREAIVMAKVFEKAHQSAMVAQRMQAKADVIREAGMTAKTEIQRRLEKPSETRGLRTTPTHRGGISRPTISRPTFASLPFQRSIVSMVVASTPAPTNFEERRNFDRALALISIIERAIATCNSLLRLMEKYLREIELVKASRQEAAFQTDQSRRLREGARLQAKNWVAAHPWQIKLATVPGLGGARDTHQGLISTIQFHDRHVQELKQTVSVHQVAVVELGRTVAELNAKRTAALGELRHAATNLKKHPVVFEQFLVALQPDDQKLVTQQLEKFSMQHQPRDGLSPVDAPTSSPSEGLGGSEGLDSAEPADSSTWTDSPSSAEGKAHKPSPFSHRGQSR